MPRQELHEATKAEQSQGQRRTDRATELEAMRTAFNAIDKLPAPGQRRAMAWLSNALTADSYEDAPF